MSDTAQRSRTLAGLIAGMAIWLVLGPPLVSWAVEPSGDEPHRDEDPASETAGAAGTAGTAGTAEIVEAGPSSGQTDAPSDAPSDETADGADEQPPAETDSAATGDEGSGLPIAPEPEPQITRPEVDTDKAVEEVAVDKLPVVSASPSPIVVEGRGWGHSVGMSQYGARAMARNNRDHRQILGHYYPDTDITSLAPGEPLRVGLLRASPAQRPTDRIRVISRRTWEAGAVWATLDGGERVPLRPGHPVTVRADGNEVVIGLAQGARRARQVRLTWDPHAAGGAAVAFPDLTDRVPATRWGQVHISAAGGVIRPTLAIDVEHYLRGLAEVPSSWPAAALRAQAVAARTYALRAAATGLDPACACHLGPTDHDQVFRGWQHEAVAGPWLQAVVDTAGKVVTRDGGLVWTYYSSSHGGRSERSVDSFAYGPEDGQWPSVDDPWSLDPAAENPRAIWSARIAHADFVEAVGMPLRAVVDVDVIARSAGGSPHTLRIVGVLPNGMPAVGTWAGDDGRGAAASLRRRLGGDVLPSQQLTDLRVAD